MTEIRFGPREPTEEEIRHGNEQIDQIISEAKRRLKMPHYKDGTEAKIGDLVKGVGYNVKGTDGKLAVIVGTLFDVTPGATSCNVKIFHAIVQEVSPSQARSVAPESLRTHNDGRRFRVTLDMEYGQADHFELIHRPELLPQ